MDLQEIDLDSDAEWRKRPSHGMKTLPGNSHIHDHCLYSMPSPADSADTAPDAAPSPQWSDVLDVSDIQESHSSFASEELSIIDDTDTLDSHLKKAWWEDAHPEDLSLSDDRLVFLLRKSTYRENPHIAGMQDRVLLAFHKSVVIEKAHFLFESETDTPSGSWFLRNGGPTIIKAISSHPEKIRCLVDMDVAVSRGEFGDHLSAGCVGARGEGDGEENIWVHSNEEICFSNDFKEAWVCEYANGMGLKCQET
jgi:hypothetical protein